MNDIDHYTHAIALNPDNCDILFDYADDLAVEGEEVRSLCFRVRRLRQVVPTGHPC